MSALVAGLGCRRGVSADTLCSLVAMVLQRTRQSERDLVLLAVPGFKDDAPFAQVAERLGVPLVHIDERALADVQDRCLTQSATTERLTGLGAVAEAAALAAGGPGATLLGPRLARDGATCAIARRGP